MIRKLTLTFAAATLFALAGFAQAPPKPPVPPIAPAPTDPNAAPQVGQAPPGLPDAKMREPMTKEEWEKWYYKEYTIPKKGAILVGPKRVRLNKMMPQVYEIVREDDTHYVVRNLPPDDPQSMGYKEWRHNERSQVSMLAKREYMKDKFLIVENTPVPPPFTDKLRFVETDAGLPKGGRWQMSFDIADMDGDGLPDLVFGPQRTGPPTPYVFLQQKDGSWKLWQGAKFPTQGLKLDYGSVRVADFDGDGKKDIAIACHFSKAYVLYGDGHGDFTRYATIPQTNPSMTSRGLAVADVNGDGRPDVITLCEVDVAMDTRTKLVNGLVNVALNLPSGWQAAETTGFKERVMGDVLATADLDMNGKVDLLLTSRTVNTLDLIYRNLGGGAAWQPIGSLRQPVYGFIYATAAGRFDRFPQPDVVECIEQHNPWRTDTPTQACIVYRFHDAEGRPTDTPTPTVLFQEQSDVINYQAAAVGDLDGDGRDDIVVVSNTGRVRVFLQGVDGDFFEQRDAGMDRPKTTITDVRIADLRGDGTREIILSGAPQANVGGGVWIFKVEKAGGPAAQAAKAP